MLFLRPVLVESPLTNVKVQAIERVFFLMKNRKSNNALLNILATPP